MRPGDPLGDHGQRAIAPAVIFEPVLADEDGMGVSAPPPHQARAGLQHAADFERTSAFLELSRQNPKAALQGAGLAVTSLREPVPDTGDKASHLARWNRVPLFLWLKARPFQSDQELY